MTNSTPQTRRAAVRGARNELPEHWTVRRRETESAFALARRAGRGRNRLLHDIVVAHLDLADTIARRYTGRPQDAEDIRQVAYVGLVKAAERFDGDKGDDFVSFAVPTIAGEIKRHLRDNGWVIRPPRPVQELRTRVTGSISLLSQQLRRTPSAREIALHVGSDVAEVEEALLAHHSLRPASLDATVGESDGPVFGETLGFVDGALDRVELTATLSPALALLSTREQRIVYLRFFEEQTQQEIARELGVTQMQVSRLLAKILQTMRVALAEGVPRRHARTRAATSSPRSIAQSRSA